ncbi:MAG TPA: MFS transporter [Candidatus Paceibacterota bacterium]
MKRNIFLWALYDFANSIVIIAFFLYFSQWYITEQGIADIWYNFIFTCTAILLLCTVPFVGKALDTGVRKLPGLRLTTVSSFVFFSLTALAGIHFPESHFVVSVLLLLGLYSYLLSFTFYTPLMAGVSSESNRGKISGIGICANYLGQIAAVLICFPFANGTLSVFGASPCLEALLPATLAFFILALPALIFFKEAKSEGVSRSVIPKNVFSDFKALCMSNGIGFFFLSYFLFNDGILTAANNFPIYLEQVFSVSDTAKSLALLTILVGSAIGAPVFGYLADKHGHKRILNIMLWAMLAVFIVLSRANLAFVFIGVGFMGFAFGGLWAVSRSIVSHLSPKNMLNSAFAYCGLVERVSTLIGPLVWGGIATGMVWMGPGRYRVATLAMAVFIFLGILALRRVPKDARTQNESSTA